MLGFDISALSGPELRRLLAQAQARGQDTLAEQLRAELAQRGPGGRRLRPAEPRPPAEDAAWEPGPIMIETLPSDLELGDLELDARSETAPRRRWPLVVGVAAAAALAAGAVGWGLGGARWLPDAPVPKPAPTAPPRLEMARAAPAAAPPGDQAKALEEDAAAAPAPAPPEPEVRGPPPRLDPCARPPTPADRLVCNDLALDMLDHEMRDAYARALSAGADPAAVRDAQAAWRQARDAASDPQSLARLYDRRIRELEAAATASPEEPEPD